ncbi:predicted protein [Lichtheimia corymbifera JMRC:FSU:9682]|uniref:Uncharacterized protein n=1 Tax=Lichtheimia corymbifera JMRC:FSU:9682 TaxID=1263082 RepID=A0A068RG27_9FUNG|nr:predicted protein [Lichtheimia corymbifera JMRC:FSU:9682]
MGCLQAGHSTLGGMATSIPCSSCSSSSSTTHPPKHVRLNEGTITTSGTVSPSGGNGDDDDDKVQDPCAIFDGWSTLGGSKCSKEYKWKSIQPDLLELFGMSLEKEY